jgi:hypothetical protein
MTTKYKDMATDYVIGNKETFAIEFKARPERPGHHLFGWLRLWLGGKYVGAYESMFILPFMLQASDRLLKSNVDADDFEGLRKDEIYRNIKFEYYPDGISFGKYWFTPSADSFDDFSIVVYGHDDVYKFVWQLWDDPHYEYKNYPKGFQSAEVPKAEIEQVTEEFRKRLDQLDKEIPIRKRGEISNDPSS